MALRDKPYLALYTKDFSTDEKLRECSAGAHGVLILLMCLLHKQEVYGTLLLKQNDKQNDKQINNFCLKLCKHLPFSFDVILSGITELLDHKVLKIEQDSMFQKRMVKDNLLSEIRAEAGSKGGKKTIKKFASKFAKAKTAANTDIDNGIDNDNSINNKGVGKFELHEIHASQLLKDSFEMDAIEMQTKKKVTSELLKMFNAHLFTEKKLHISSPKYNSHLRSWINKKPENSKKESKVFSDKHVPL